MKIVFPLLFLVLLTNLSFAQDTITVKVKRASEKIIRVHFSEVKEDSLLGQVQSKAKVYDRMHSFSLDNSLPMTMHQSPVLPYMHFNKKQDPVKFNIPTGVNLPANKNELAFLFYHATGFSFKKQKDNFCRADKIFY